MRITMPHRRSTLFLLASLAPAPLLVAEDPATPEIPVPTIAPIASPTDAFRLSVHWENDGTTLKPNGDTDRYYTNGAGFTLSWRNEFATQATEWIPFPEKFDTIHRAVGFTAGQLMFTPADISINPPDPTDRPYAGYLYFGVFFQRSNEQTLDHIQLDIGLTGNSTLAENAQKIVHDVFNEPDPKGWDSQLEDEPTIQLTLRKKWRFDLGEVKLNDIPPIQFQVIPEAELAVGTVHRYAKAGLLFRLGFQLPDDFGPDQLLHIGSFTGLGQTQPWGGYLFTRISGKAVEHNLFLEGNSWKDSAGVDEEALVGEIQFGFGLQFRKSENFIIDVTYSQIYLTEEFEDQDGHHGYGTISLSFTWRF